ncbi:MAG: CPBP family intramembrane metalloprotease [Candidatus Cloacimonetes bacterium]|nr:CPBP family intramembrane metalloprotease [Candidatus Cloacimonadota bacterium]
MSNLKRIGVELSVWFLACFIMPMAVMSSGIIKPVMEKLSWYGPAEATQTVLLLCALIITLVWKKGFAAAGFRFGSGRLVLIACGVAIAVAVSSNLLEELLFPLHTAMEGDHPAVSGILLKDVLSIWIGASFIEEFLLRGVLMRILIDEGKPMKFFAWQNIIPAVQFGIIHLPLLSFMPARIVASIVFNAVLLGLIAGYYRQKSNSLLPAYCVHMSFNVVMMLLPRLMA